MDEMRDTHGTQGGQGTRDGHGTRDTHGTRGGHGGHDPRDTYERCAHLAAGGGREARGLDHRLLSAMRDCGGDPRVAAAARALSFAGEHGALWIAAGLTGAAVDRERRGAWLRGTALTATAHLVSMGVKRIVRRPRPSAVEPLVRTAGRHSFPSSHASSAAAAAVAYGALGPAGRRVVPPLAAAMCVSRLVVGVHYPSDVVAGALLGGLTARLGAAWMSGAAAVAACPAGPAESFGGAR